MLAGAIFTSSHDVRECVTTSKLQVYDVNFRCKNGIHVLCSMGRRIYSKIQAGTLVRHAQ
jgi:hypothetical protein